MAEITKEGALSLIQKIEKGILPEKEILSSLITFLSGLKEEELSFLFERARKVTEEVFGNKVYIRGLIEFSNYCHNNCYYCGIRKDNKNARRYRLTEEEILSCCEKGWQLGFRTFVLQSGEDDFFSSEDIARIVRKIKKDFPQSALTLSIGEKSFEDYKLFREAGSDRYLLRHESADKNHFSKLKPPSLTFEKRMKCLKELKDLGYQTGAGFMVGSPFQTSDCLAQDLLFVKEFQPEMIGIGPFIPHQESPFKSFPQGSVKETLIMLSLLRLTCPHALLPSTTALGTADPFGREKGLMAGANVVMPNLSPRNVRKDYQLYDNKLSSGSEAAEGLEELRERLKKINRIIVVDRGDFKKS
ncbi:MAG: [FeFe] hydrogenase H-cluster radical SAM maturase HydE [Treponema sp.]|nr:[FeFe] hydrogenase H-cluster radical SAM maturase HydE [Treponema sp.]